MKPRHFLVLPIWVGLCLTGEADLTAADVETPQKVLGLAVGDRDLDQDQAIFSVFQQLHELSRQDVETGTRFEKSRDPAVRSARNAELNKILTAEIASHNLVRLAVICESIHRPGHIERITEDSVWEDAQWHASSGWQIASRTRVKGTSCPSENASCWMPPTASSGPESPVWNQA